MQKWKMKILLWDLVQQSVPSTPWGWTVSEQTLHNLCYACFPAERVFIIYFFSKSGEETYSAIWLDNPFYFKLQKLLKCSCGLATLCFCWESQGETEKSLCLSLSLSQGEQISQMKDISLHSSQLQILVECVLKCYINLVKTCYLWNRSSRTVKSFRWTLF